ncbi:hypothetical protein Droror1_Dr00024948 [Drosera rotundifolia]
MYLRRHRPSSKEREVELIHQFLLGLKDTVYRSLRSNIMSQESLPSLQRVYSLAVQEERHLTVVKNREVTPPNSMVLATQRADNQRPPRPKCAHCGKPGYDITKCYRLIGFPENFVFSNGRGTSPSSPPSSGSSTPGGNSSSPASSGRGRGRGSGVVNAAHQPNSGPSNTSLSAQDRAALGPAVTQEQWNQFL